jgi:hypothetical protein
MNMVKGLRAERLIAERYEERGYVVTLGPPRSAIPFPLGNYTPDILAIKGDEKVLIEVKTSGARINQESYFRLDQEVQRHPGWRFLLVTVSDAELQEYPSSVASNVSIESIRENLRNMDPLVDDPKMSRLVLPSLWMAYVSALRLLVLDEDVELDDYTDLSLINKAYSGGMISIDEYETARHLMTLRNQAVHSFDTAATPPDCQQLLQMVCTILDRIPASFKPAQPSEETKSE